MYIYGFEALELVEMLTSGEGSYEIAPRDTDRELDIPSPVLDLLFFGRQAKGAATAISDGKLESIEETCPTLSRLAAILATRTKFRTKVYDLMHEISARIICALDKQELAELWDGGTSHREFIETLAFIPGLSFCSSIFVDTAISSMVNTLENFEELSPEAAAFAMRHMDNVACSDFDDYYVMYMIEMRRKAIDVIEAGEKLSAEWREKAIEALLSMDFDSEIHLTKENELKAEELVNDIMEHANPQDIAITVAWLSAIYLYTEYGDRIVEFFDIEINYIEAEDHQEIVDDETPDGQAA